jgi:hypothetical protein
LVLKLYKDPGPFDNGSSPLTLIGHLQQLRSLTLNFVVFDNKKLSARNVTALVANGAIEHIQLQGISVSMDGLQALLRGSPVSHHATNESSKKYFFCLQNLRYVSLELDSDFDQRTLYGLLREFDETRRGNNRKRRWDGSRRQHPQEPSTLHFNLQSNLRPKNRGGKSDFRIIQRYNNIED